MPDDRYSGVDVDGTIAAIRAGLAKIPKVYPAIDELGWGRLKIFYLNSLAANLRFKAACDAEAAMKEAPND